MRKNKKKQKKEIYKWFGWGAQIKTNLREIRQGCSQSTVVTVNAESAVMVVVPLNVPIFIIITIIIEKVTLPNPFTYITSLSEYSV